MTQKAPKKTTTKKAAARKPPKKTRQTPTKKTRAQAPRSQTSGPTPRQPRRLPRVTGGPIPPLGSQESSPLWRWRKKTTVIAAKTPAALQKAIDAAQAVASNGDVFVRCVHSPTRGTPWFTLSYMERHG